MTFVAVVAICVSGIGVLYGPFFIGKQRDVYTAKSYLYTLAESAVLGLLAGRVLGWW